MRRLMLVAFVALAATLTFGQSSEEATRKKIVEVAFKYRGVPYIYGSESPKAFDCSGFVRYVYREAFGIELPRSARGFYSAGTPIDWKLARMGDVFVYDTVGGAPSHVSIVVGDGTVIHAVSDGPKTGVIVSPMTDRYWEPRLIAARTFIAALTPSTPKTPASPATPAIAATPATPKTPAIAATPASPATPAIAATPATPKTPAIAATPAIPDEPAISDIGFTIPAVKATFTDNIPTAAGSSVAFTLTNGTGKDGSFMVLFFRVDPKTYKLRQIHEERVKLAAKASFSLPPYNFKDAGKYKLIVKDSWGNQLFERVFMVNAAEG